MQTIQTISFMGSLHFFAGSVTLLAGFSALLLSKGTRFHKLSGRIFVWFMLALTLSGLYLSVERQILFTVFLALLTLYSFLTGWATMASNRTAMLISKYSPVGAFCIAFGATLGAIKAASSVDGSLNDLPYGAFLFIAGVALCCFILDLKHRRGRLVSRRSRLSRHIWRMGFSLFLSTAIFFFGNNHVLPESWRTPLVLSAPVVLVMAVTAVYLVVVAVRSKTLRY